jgi:hypothetical protein
MLMNPRHSSISRNPGYPWVGELQRTLKQLHEHLLSDYHLKQILQEMGWLQLYRSYYGARSRV